MSRRWPSVRLEEACLRVTDGTHQSPRFEPDGIPFLVISDVVSGEIDWSGVSKWVSEETYEANTSRCRPARGDVLYTAVGSFGVAVPVATDQRFMFQRHIAHIKPDPHRAYTRFLAHILNSPTIRAIAERVAKGVAQRTVTLGDLKNFEIPLPPLAEQRRIADILDKADAIRRKRREAIALTEELLRSAFLEMFGDPVTNPKRWPVKPLGDLLATDPRIGTLVPASDNPGTLVVRVGELGAYDVDLSRSKRAALSDAEFERYGLKTGDVLLARAIGSEDHLGKASVLQPHGQPVAFDSHVMRLRFRDEYLDPYVFVQWLRTPGGRARFMNEAGRTAVQFNVNGRQIVKVQIPLPPRAEQQRFRRLFESTRSMTCRSSDALDEAHSLFNSLVARAFSGELST